MRFLSFCFFLFCFFLGTAAAQVQFVGPTKWLNGARAAVSHTIDDSTKFVPAAIDAMDKHGIKATIFVSTARSPIAELWPRLRAAIANGHEVGSHSRTHQCKWPDDAGFCSAAYSEAEIAGSRDDILKNTNQPHVWSWCYPCGNCAGQEEIQKRLSAAGYIVARNYPDEANDGHLVPNMNTFAANPMNAAYTQSVQVKGGIAKNGNTDVAKLNAKFDEVLAAGGIYNFLSHPQWLEYGPEQFYERHMAYVGNRKEVWYVPMGPLYAYQTLRASVQVQPVAANGFRVAVSADREVYNGSVTLEFRDAAGMSVLANGKALPPAPAITSGWTGSYVRHEGGRTLVTVPPGATIEFRGR